MSDLLDLRPSTRELAGLVQGVRDDQLGGPTPCPDWTVADLLEHVGGLAVAFEHAATKEPLPAHDGSGTDGAHLPPGFRADIDAALARLADAWTEPAAWEGLTMAGPVELPAPVAAQVALNEVVVHSWDLAVATGQAWDADPAAVATCTRFVTSFEPPAGSPADDGGLFGPPVTPTDGASDVDVLVAAAGRRPDWAVVTS